MGMEQKGGKQMLKLPKLTKVHYLYLAAGVIVITAAVILGVKFYNRYKEEHTPSDVRRDLAEYYNVPEGETMLIIDGEIISQYAINRYGSVYLSEDLAKYYVKRLFINDDGRVIYTTSKAITYYTPDESVYLVKGPTLEGESADSGIPVVISADGGRFYSLDFLKDFGITCELYENPGRLLITKSTTPFLSADVAEDTEIRVGHSIKEDILKNVSVGDHLRIIDGGGIRENGFIKVMSDDGVRGYVLSEKLSDTYYLEPTLNTVEPEKYKHFTYASPIYLGWQLMYLTDSVPYLEAAVKNAPEMNTISPTWFFIKNTDGELLSYASHEYVERAHELGLKVWALYKNDTVGDTFTVREGTHTVLSTEEGRAKLIGNILSSVEEYGLDGINIDFESLNKETGIYFIEFLRELSVYCRLRGIVLSVDNYVPMNYNSFYDLPEQSELVDYVIIMGYDEHYAGSDTAGSVSSITWFSNAVKNTADRVEARRIIMGVPFYTRLWKETATGTGVKVSVEKNMTMDEAKDWIYDYRLSGDWSKSDGQYYFAKTEGEVTYRLWQETIYSLELKTKVAAKAGVGGIAAWKLGDETEGTWAAIKAAFENKEE